jgi:hypothetical protein
MADFVFTGNDNIQQGNNKDVLDNIFLTFTNYKKFSSVVYTNPISVTQMNGNITKIKEPVHNNVYFIFDNNGSCQYVGIKENKKNINYRLKLHMLSNKSAGTKSCISKLLSDILLKPATDQLVYYITYEVEPNWMATAVESYFIEYFKGLNPPQARWVARK